MFPDEFRLKIGLDIILSAAHEPRMSIPVFCLFNRMVLSDSIDCPEQINTERIRIESKIAFFMQLVSHKASNNQHAFRRKLMRMVDFNSFFSDNRFI